MTSPKPDWCEDPQALGERDLRLLIEVAASVLGQAADGEADAEEIIEYPPSVLHAELHSALAEFGIAADESAITRLVNDAESDRALGMALIESMCSIPELRDAVDEAYEARRRIMVIDPATIAAVSLLLLVMKVRRVRVGREGVDVTLDPVREGALGFISKLLNL